jgi:Ras family
MMSAMLQATFYTAGAVCGCVEGFVQALSFRSSVSCLFCCLLASVLDVARLTWETLGVLFLVQPAVLDAAQDTVAAAFQGRVTLLPIILLGNSGVGKTALVHRYLSTCPAGGYKPTLGADLFVKELDIDGARINMQVREKPMDRNPNQHAGA